MIHVSGTPDPLWEREVLAKELNCGKQQPGHGDLRHHHFVNSGADSGVKIGAGDRCFSAGSDGLNNRFGLLRLDPGPFEVAGGSEGVE